MSELKLAIKHYEAIESLQVIFRPGLHAITGASNNGKSSLFRAVYSLLYNKHSDNAIQQGQDAYIIGIEYDNNKVLCKRNQTQSMKTSYQVNGKNITKVGRNTLEEVDEALNMAIVDLAGTKVELNITEQFSYPFLLDMTPGKLYTFLSQSSTQEDLYVVLKEMKTDLRDIDDNRKKLEGTVEMAKQTYDESLTTYNNLRDSDFTTNTILNMQAEVNYLSMLETSCNRLSICDKDLLQVAKTLQDIRMQLDIIEPLDTLLEEVESLDVLRNDMSKLKDKLIKYKDVQQSYNILVNMLNKLDFSTIDNALKELNDLEVYKTNITNKINALDNRMSALELYDKELNKVNERIKDTNVLDTLYKGYVSTKDFVYDITSVLNKINTLDTELVNTLNSIQDIDNELNTINKELSEFKVCPVCGKDL